MLNFSTRVLAHCVRLSGFSLIVFGCVVSTNCLAASKYKKSTVVDFEGALVEGKSRKPYSSYLTQQKELAFEDLHAWEPNLTQRIADTKARLDLKP